MMKKSDIIDNLAKNSELTKKDVKAIVDGVFDQITEALGRGEEVTIVNFGRFDVRHRAARNGRNPRTGEEIVIAAQKSPGFKAGLGLRSAVKDAK